jgi:hypothetical protein
MTKVSFNQFSLGHHVLYDLGYLANFKLFFKLLFLLGESRILKMWNHIRSAIMITIKNHDTCTNYDRNNSQLDSSPNTIGGALLLA